MKTALDLARLLAYCALIVLLGECALAVHRLRPKLEVTVSNIDRATIAAGAAAGNVEKASRQWSATQQQVAKDSTAVLQETKTTLASLRTGVAHTDAALGTLLEAGRQAIDSQSQSGLETQAKLRESLTGLTDSNKELQRVLAEAGAVISSPELQKSLASLADASNNTATATANLAASTKDVQIVADKFKDDFVKPKNRLWAYFKSVLDLGSKAKILF